MHSRLRRLLISLVLVGMVLAALLGIGAYAMRDSLHTTLAHWTGEEDLREQLKGTVALALLRLTTPPPRTDPYVPIEHSGLPPYGVNTFLEQEVEADKVDLSLRLISEAGFHWVRQEFPWEDIEIAGKGDFWDPKWNISTWSKYDRIVQLANKHGLELIVRLDNPPAWTRARGDAEGWGQAPPDNLEDFGDFVYAVVSRYRGRVRYYQIWNEPNIYPEWGDQPADPAGYVELLKVAYRRAKEADPHCVIIAAGLAQTTEETPEEFGPRNMSDLLYLEKMYQAGVQGHFDVMGAMVYGLWTGPYDLRTSRDRTNYSRVQLLREIMVRHGDGHKPIWATEVGWCAVPEDFAGTLLHGRVSEEQQATYAVEAYQRAQQEWPWMGVMNYWFLRRPSDAEANQSWYYFRMLEPDFTPLPAYARLASAAQEVPQVAIGYHQESHWALDYSGNWAPQQDAAAVLGGYTLGQPGAALEFVFEGTDLALVLRDPAQAAQLQIEIDGRSHLPGKPVALEGSDAPIQYVVRGLPEGPHWARLVVLDEPVGLDGLVVFRRPLRVGWLTAGGALAIVALAGVFLGVRRRAHERSA